MSIEIQPISIPKPVSTRATHEIFKRKTTPGLFRSSIILPAILLLLYLCQCAWFVQSQSFTFDEPIDIVSGLEQWRTAQYSGGQGLNDHPPLARLLCTLPVINSKFQIDEKVAPNTELVAWHNSNFASYNRILPNPEAVAWRTRSVDVALGLILGALLWLAARSLYSADAANFVLALFAFSPSLIAHFSLGATNDGVMTLMLFAAVYQFCRWRYNPSWSQTTLLAIALGGLLISKASSLPFFAGAVVLMLVTKPDRLVIRPSEWNWKQAAVAVLISFLIIWGAYQFHVSKLTLTATDISGRLSIPGRPEPVIRNSGRAFEISVPIPAFEYFQGIAYQFEHNQAGHFAYLLGRRYIGGSRLYFPVVVLLKWPTMVLLLFLLTTVLMLWRRISLPRDFALWAAVPLLYFVLAEFARFNLGERYILPIYPFALLLCGSLWQMAKRRGAVLVVLLIALAINTADVLSYAPDYLSYFNLFVNRAASYKLLSDSNLDWGEGLIALHDYQQAHPSVPIHLAYFGSVAPALYGIQAIPLLPKEQAPGTVIISANYLSGQTLPDPDSYRWVLQYPVKLILNHSLYVFEVPDHTKHSS